jgi:hypothetical protein
MKKTTTTTATADRLTADKNTGQTDTAQVGDRVRSFDFVDASECVEGIVTSVEWITDEIAIYTFDVDREWRPINDTKRDAPSEVYTGEYNRVGQTIDRVVDPTRDTRLGSPGFVNLTAEEDGEDGEEADPAAPHPTFPHRDVRGRFTVGNPGRPSRMLSVARLAVFTKEQRERLHLFGPGASVVKVPDQVRTVYTEAAGHERRRVRMGYRVVVPLPAVNFPIQYLEHERTGWLGDGSDTGENGGSRWYVGTREEAERVAAYVEAMTGAECQVDAYNLNAGQHPCFGVSRVGHDRNNHLMVANFWTNELKRVRSSPSYEGDWKAAG